MVIFYSEFCVRIFCFVFFFLHLHVYPYRVYITLINP